MAKSKNHTNHNQCKCMCLAMRTIIHQLSYTIAVSSPYTAMNWKRISVDMFRKWCSLFRVVLFVYTAFKNHRNGIKKAKKNRYPPMTGVSFSSREWPHWILHTSLLCIYNRLTQSFSEICGLLRNTIRRDWKGSEEKLGRRRLLS